MFIRSEITSTYSQIFFMATDTTDFPDWDDTSLSKGLVSSTNAFYVSTENDILIDVIITDSLEHAKKYRLVGEVVITSPTKRYTLNSLDSAESIEFAANQTEINIAVYADHDENYEVKRVVLLTQDTLVPVHAINLTLQRPIAKSEICYLALPIDY